MSEPERIEGANAALSIWRTAPSLGGARTAALGAFTCETGEAGAALLEVTMARLAAEGFGAVLGPMNGDTWASYRLVVDSDGAPPFLMEPHNPVFYPSAFEATGFAIVSRYFSAERAVDARHPGRALPPGHVFKPFGKSVGELEHIHALSLVAFAQNAFYAPITAERFIASYTPFLDKVDPDLVLLAEDEAGALKGFLFAVPNYAEGAAPGSVILKTYASLTKGLGSALAAEFHRRAAVKGYRRVIHALMHEDNLSAMHSGNLGARVFRRYALWGKTL
jgi:hypothetical protein